MARNVASFPQNAHDERCGPEWDQCSNINECHCSLAACCAQRMSPRSSRFPRASERLRACGVSSI
jgi:hypothetical protein